MSITICLDPGHYNGYNRGAYTNYYEGTKMYDLAVMLKNELDLYDGIKTIITRNSVSENPSLAQRAQIAKNNNARCFLSLHTNACNTESVNRIDIYRSVAMPESEELGFKIMKAIFDTISKDVPTTSNNAILTRLNSSGTDYYGVLRNSTGGSVKESFIIEHVFHTNYKQSEWMYNNDNLRKLAIAEAKTLAEYYGYSKKSNSNTSISSDNESVSLNQNYTKYTVLNGDSWWSIASKKMGSGSKMNELASFNGKTINSILHPGDVIKIPLTSNPYKKYTVNKGDSWWSISRDQLGLGSKYKYLANYNGMSTDDVLNPGDVIKIPL